MCVNTVEIMFKMAFCSIQFPELLSNLKQFGDTNHCPNINHFSTPITVDTLVIPVIYLIPLERIQWTSFVRVMELGLPSESAIVSEDKLLFCTFNKNSFAVNACDQPFSAISNAEPHYPTTNATAFDPASPPAVLPAENIKIECDATYFLNLTGTGQTNSYTATCNSTLHWEFPADPGSCVQTMACSDPVLGANNLTQNYSATITDGNGFQ